MGGDDRINQYRLPRRRPLPQFGGDPNPFASTVRPGGVREGSQPMPVAPAATEAPVSPVTEAPSAPPAKPSWLARFNPFRRAATPTVPALPSAPAATSLLQRTEQTELSLQNVRVMRNDLSDAEEAAPRPRLKGRQLLGRRFPRSLGAEEVALLDADQALAAPPPRDVVGAPVKSL